MRKASGRRPRLAWVPFAIALVAGAALGVAAKLADQSAITGAGDLGTYLGFWVVAATLVAAWSRTPRAAVLRVVLFMLGMIAAYYLSAWRLFGVLPARYALAWGAAALVLSPLFALITWPARQQGWLAAIAAALPVGLLLAEAYSFRWVLPLHLVPFVFDLVAAVGLFAWLPRGLAQHGRAAILVPLAFLGARWAQLALPYVLPILR